MLAKVANFALFQLLWFACILGAAREQHAYALGGAALCIGLAFLISDSRRRDAWLVLVVASGGFALDSAEVALGVYRAAGPRLAEWATPWWFVCLWAGFATTLGSSFAWSLARPKLAIAVGAVAGPLAYVSGEKLGALELGEPRARSLALLAVAWAVALALCVVAARALNARFPPLRRATARVADAGRAT
ncbi:MAG: DUF2878 domain-containing protein [Planctomycetes bacterium]|nr:DUF2878 domain-containing protein [Planctomycetota bacterium]